MIRHQNRYNGGRQFVPSIGRPISQSTPVNFLLPESRPQEFATSRRYNFVLPPQPSQPYQYGVKTFPNTPPHSFSGLSTTPIMPKPITPKTPIVPTLSAPSMRNGATKPLTGRKKLLFAAIPLVVLVVLLSVGGYYYLRTAAGTDVTLYQVNNQRVPQYVGGGGIVFPNQQVDISYPVVERVVSVFVKPGDYVSVNQPLIQLDPSQLSAQITEASNEVASAQAFLNSVSASGNSVTIAQAQQAYDNAKSKYDALVAQLSSFTLHDGKLIAPLNGVVTAVNVDASEVFMADKPLITIMDESTAIVHVEVPLVSLGQVHLGQAAAVTPSALPNLNLKGTVSAIIPQADPQTDTYEVWVVVPNQADTLLPGMSAFVRIQSGGQAAVVPRLAVLNADREAIVFVVRNQRAYMQHVHVIGRSVDAIYIDSGIASGDQLVLVGLDSVQEGQKVHVTHIEKGL